MSLLPAQNCVGIANNKTGGDYGCKGNKEDGPPAFQLFEGENETTNVTLPACHPSPNICKGTKKLQSVTFQLVGWVNGMQTERSNVACAATDGGARKGSFGLPLWVSRGDVGKASIHLLGCNS